MEEDRLKLSDLRGWLHLDHGFSDYSQRTLGSEDEMVEIRAAA